MQRGMLQPGAKTAGGGKERERDERDHQAFPTPTDLLCKRTLFPFANRKGTLQAISVRRA